jgi:hypothetical protein
MPPRLSAAGVGAGLDVVEVLGAVDSEDDEQAARRVAHANRRVGDFRMGRLALPLGRGIEQDEWSVGAAGRERKRDAVAGGSAAEA